MVENIDLKRYFCPIISDHTARRIVGFFYRFVFFLLALNPVFPQQLLADENLQKNFQGKFFQSRNENVGVDVAAIVDPENIRAGKSFQIRLRLTIPEGWHIYSLTLEGEEASLATQIHLDKNEFLLRGWKESQPRMEMDGVLQKIVKSHSNHAEFNAHLKVPAQVKPGAYPITGTVVYHACDNKICNLPKEIHFNTQISISSE